MDRRCPNAWVLMRVGSWVMVGWGTGGWLASRWDLGRNPEWQGGWVRASARRAGRRLPIPAWPAAAASPRPPRRGPAGPAPCCALRACMVTSRRSQHPRLPSLRPPALSPASPSLAACSATRRGSLQLMHLGGWRANEEERKSLGHLDHRGGGRSGRGSMLG